MLIDLPRVAHLNRPKTLPPIRPTMALKADLASIYRPVTDIWSAAIPAIMAAYNPTPLQIDTADEAQSAIEQAARAASILVIGLTVPIRSLAVRVVEWHKGKFSQYVLTATGISLDTILAGAQSGDTVATFLARNVALIKSVSDDVQAKIADRVFRGFQERSPAREVAKDLAQIVDGGRKRGLRIASDQMQKLSAQLDTERMLDVGIKRWKWRHSEKRFPRPEHVARDGKIYAFNKPPEDMPGELPFCFLGRQPVGFNGDVKKLWRRSYSGETPVLITDAGKVLRSTPNHPVLTDAGWKPAKDVKVGDYLVNASLDGFDAFKLDIEQRQPRIADMFQAAQVAGVVVSSNGRGGEFHGDHAVNQNIDVIDFSDDGLRNSIVSAIPQDLAHLILKKAEVVSDLAISHCLLHGLCDRDSSAVNSVVGGLHLLDALLWRQLSPDDATGLACISDIHAALNKTFGEGFARQSYALTNREYALARKIGLDRTIAVKLLAVTSMLRAGVNIEVAPGAESLGEIVTANAQLGRDGFNRAPGVDFGYSKVEQVVTEMYAGHVYNLQTETNWYVAGNHIVHNCGCVKQAMLPAYSELD